MTQNSQDQPHNEAPDRRPSGAADQVIQGGLNSGLKAGEIKLEGLASQAAAKKVGSAAKNTAAGAATKAAGKGAEKLAGAAKPSTGGAAEAVTKKLTSKAADRVSKNADLSTAEGAQKAERAQIASDLVAGAAGGAVEGAKGGAVGAGVGAVLGAAKGLASNAAARRRLQKPAMIALGLVVVLMLAPVLVASTAVTAMVGSLSSFGQSDDEATESSIQATVDRDGNGHEASAKLTADALADAQKYEAVPWQVLAAAKHELGDDTDGIDLGKVAAGIEQRDPDAVHRDLANGALRSGSDPTQHLYITEPGEGGSDETWDSHEKTKEVMIASLKDGGATDEQADRIWNNALSWSLGIISGCATSNTGDSASTGGSSSSGDGTVGVTLDSLSPAQVANAKTIMGIAKGMFGNDWKAASVIALLTSMQESKLQIAANDGVVKNEYMADGSILADETGRTNEWPLDAYPIVAKSQKYTHQFTGSMYLTLGLFQQMANQHWSTLGAATWDTDPDAAVARLMDPQFSAFAFFRGLRDKAPNWKSLDPIAAAEIVQVSGMGENTRKWKDLAEQIVEAHGADAPKLTPPDDGGTSEGGVTVEGDTSGCDVDNVAPPTGVAGTVGANGWAWPTDTRAVMQGPHLGLSLDLASSPGGPLFAAHSGIVVKAGGDGEPFGPYCPTIAWWRGENRTVMVQSVYQGKTLFSSHNHVGDVHVKVGQTVKAGQQVASEGMSGCTSAPHNHFFVASAPLFNGDIDAFQYIGRP